MFHFAQRSHDQHQTSKKVNQLQVGLDSFQGYENIQEVLRKYTTEKLQFLERYQIQFQWKFN